MADEGLIDPIVEGVDPDCKYAFLCWDGWAEERDDDDNIVVADGDRFGIRTDQLELFLIAAQEARLAALEAAGRSEEHTSELQSLMRISYAVFCLKKKKTTTKD